MEPTIVVAGLEYISGYETVQFAMVVGFVIIVVAYGVARRAKQSEKLKSDDAKHFAAQQIELAYANQLRVAQDSMKKSK